MSPLIRRLSCFVLSSVSGHVAAATHVWPGTAPCQSTLSACVLGAAAGDTIQVLGSSVDESIVINKSLVLEPKPYVDQKDVTFTPGHHLEIRAVSTQNIEVTLRDLRFMRGHVFVNDSSSGAVRIEARGLDFEDVTAATDAFRVVAGGGGLLEIDVSTSVFRLDADSADADGIEVTLAGATTATARFRYNRFDRTGGSGGTAINWFGAGSGGSQDVIVAGNVIGQAAARAGGSFGFKAGIVLAQQNAAATANHFVYSNAIHTARGDGHRGGIHVVAGQGFAQLRAYNNSVFDGQTGIRLVEQITTNGFLSAQLVNNLVAGHAGRGIDIDPESEAQGSITNHHNAVYANGSESFTPGAGTLFVDPQLRPDRAGFLADGSPLIDAGDISTLLPLLIELEEPMLDGAGLRRFKGNLPEIGAYEHGDVVLAERTDVTRTTLILDHPALDANSNHYLLVTAVGKASSNFAAGSDLLALRSVFDLVLQRWRIWRDPIADFPAGSGVHVLAPAQGAGAFRHTTSAGNVGGAGTNLNFNASGDTILLLGPTAASSGTSPANPHPLGAWFFDGAWYAVNLDGAPMPLNLRMNVYHQPPSANVFVHRAYPRVISLELSGSEVEHPLLDGTPCAQPMLGQSGNGPAGFNARHAFLHYDTLSRTWRIHNQDESDFTPGTEFYVLVDPAQVEACRFDHVFSSSFEVYE